MMDFATNEEVEKEKVKQRHPMVWPEDRNVKTTAVSWRAARLPRDLNPCGYRHSRLHVFYFLYVCS